MIIKQEKVLQPQKLIFEKKGSKVNEIIFT